MTGLKRATEHPGSWWPDWLKWLKSHDAKRPARKIGGGKPADGRRARPYVVRKADLTSAGGTAAAVSTMLPPESIKIGEQQ